MSFCIHCSFNWQYFEWLKKVKKVILAISCLSLQTVLLLVLYVPSYWREKTSILDSVISTSFWSMKNYFSRTERQVRHVGSKIQDFQDHFQTTDILLCSIQFIKLKGHVSNMSNLILEHKKVWTKVAKTFPTTELLINLANREQITFAIVL